MKRFLDHCSRRFGYDGWALRVKGAEKPLEWSTCTTRAEARELRRDKRDLITNLEIVKVRVNVEVANG